MRNLSKVIAICTSPQKGTQKKETGESYLRPHHGIEGDAHAGDWHRQVSLLADESIQKARDKGLDLAPGAFGENLVTEGLELVSLPIGTRLAVGPDAFLEVTQIGKECHAHCAIHDILGECIMPKEGIFGMVLSPGKIVPGDPIKVDNRNRIAVLTVSDRSSRGEREDLTGPMLKDMALGLGLIVEYLVVPDERDAIEKALMEMSDNTYADLILTSGGTGLGPRDVTPEATKSVVDRLVPGLPEAMRQGSQRHTPMAPLSRAVAGIRHRTLIVNLPGSPKAARENLDTIMPALPHALETLRGSVIDCGYTHAT